MKIILSPAKKMNEDLDASFEVDLPQFVDQTEEILAWLRSKSHEELKTLWKCKPRQRLEDQRTCTISEEVVCMRQCGMTVELSLTWHLRNTPNALKNT